MLDPSEPAHTHVDRRLRSESLHLGDDGAGGDVVSIEGAATVEPDTPRADRVDDYLAKYRAAIEALGYEPGPFASTWTTAIRVRPTRLRVW